MPSQALPKLIAPNCRGDTRMPADLERTLYLPSEVGGSGAGSKRDMLMEASVERDVTRIGKEKQVGMAGRYVSESLKL